MDIFQTLLDNENVVNGSFLEYLHEQDKFHIESFQKLCDCIAQASKACTQCKTISYQIVFIYSQILKHFIYHFDPDDFSKISDLPSNYGEYLENLDMVVMQYFKSQVDEYF